MGELTWLHDLLIAVLVAITFLLARVMADYVVCTYTSSSLLENQIVEALWTALPGLLLICIALPSLRILYLIEEIDVPLLTCKILASQWW
jgi:cytochrome c oxidase subunit 2